MSQLYLIGITMATYGVTIKETKSNPASKPLIHNNPDKIPKILSGIIAS